jgi:hypothetical protein
MATGAVVTVTPVTIRGIRHHKCVIAETDYTSTTYTEIPGVPLKGTIISYKATLTAGTGTTINPKAGLTATFTVSTQTHIGTNTATAVHVHDQTLLRYDSTEGTAGSIWIQSSPNDATADHAISTVILIVDGWL